MAIQIILADTNEEYLSRLKRYIEFKYGEKYYLTVVYNKEELRSTLAKNKYEVLLFAPEFYEQSINFKNVQCPIILLDEEEHIAYPDKFKRSMNKYTRITTLIRFIDEAYEEVKNNAPIIYGVYGPAGGVGKTTMAMALAMSYAKVGRKALYLNLEDVDSTGLYFNTSSDLPIEHLLSSAQQSYEKMLSQLIQKDEKTGVYYFVSTREVFDPCTATCEDIMSVMETLFEGEIVNTIIIDFSSSLMPLSCELFEKVDHLVLVTTGSQRSVYKLEHFLKNEEILSHHKGKLELIMNQGKEIGVPKDIKVIGLVDKLFATSPLAISQSIAQSNCIQIKGVKSNE